MVQPNPGSKEAIEAGCICPVIIFVFDYSIDNHYDKGQRDDYNHYLVNDECPLHSHIVKQNQAEVELYRLSQPNLLKDLQNKDKQS